MEVFKYEKRVFGRSTKPRDKLIIYNVDSEDLKNSYWEVMDKYNQYDKNLARLTKEIKKHQTRIEKSETKKDEKKIEKEMGEKRAEMRGKKKDYENIKEKLIELIRKDSLSRGEVLGFMKELHSLKEEHRMKMDSLMAERLAKMHSILSEEQREKLAKKIEEFEYKRKSESKKKIK